MAMSSPDDLKKELRGAMRSCCEDAEIVLTDLLTSFLVPSFGALSKREMELEVFSALRRIGFIGNSESDQIFELNTKLRVTTSKARSLVYSYNLRTVSPDSLYEKARELFSNPVLKANGEKVYLEVTDPYLTDFIKSKARSNQVFSDGSFSSTAMAFTCSGYATLCESLFDREEDREQLRQILSCLDKEDGSIADAIKSVSKRAASDAAVDMLKQVLVGFGKTVPGQLMHLFGQLIA